MSKLPDIKQMICLWQESLSGVLSYASDKIKIDYIYHTTIVAKTASIIAEKSGLDKEKAYALGLLHDYGKIKNEKLGMPHFLEGYYQMMSLGFPDIAKICLTHSFPIKDFSFKDYTSYNKNFLSQTKELLSKIEFDYYDRLIQFCDIISEGKDLVKYEARLECIRNRYNLTDEQTKNLKVGAEQNKACFDKLCGCDVYTLLKIC